MNNVKRIIAAGLVGTAVISTGVVASAKTYEEQLQESFKAAKVPDDLAAQLTSLASAYTLTEEEGKQLQAIADSAVADTANYTIDDIYNDKDGVLSKLQRKQKVQLERLLNVTIVGSPSTGVSVYKGDSDKPIFELSVESAKSLLKGSGMSRDGVTTIVPSLVSYMTAENKKGEIPDTPDPKPTPDPDKPATETPDTPFTPGDSTTTQEYIDAVNKLEAGKDWNDEQVKALADIKTLVADMLANGFTLDQLNQAEALLAKLPTDSEQYKTLKATIDYLKTYQNNNGQTAGDAQVEATKTPSNNNNNDSATSGSTAKTATNFGNVAVAGLGLMTVAGTVFVISKKKIQ